MAKKGLFVIRSPKGKIMSAKDLERDTNTFDDKMKAKGIRDKLNEDGKFTPEAIHAGQGFTISLGPDHWRNQ